MMQPTDAPFLTTIPTASFADASSRVESNEQRRPQDFYLSMLPPPSAWREVNDDDDCSSATSLTLNFSTDSQEDIEEEQRDGSDVWMHEATRDEQLRPNYYISWFNESRNNDDHNNCGNNNALTSPQSRFSSLNSYCAAFNILDSVWYDDQRHSNATTATAMGGQEDAEDNSSEDGFSVEKENGSYGDEENKENKCPNSVKDVPCDGHDDVGVLVVFGPLSEGGALVQRKQTHSSLTRNSSFCDASSVDLTSCHVAEEGDECWEYNYDDLFHDRTRVPCNGKRPLPSSLSSTAIVTNRNAWRSAFASGGELPSIRVYAQPRDLYCNRRNVAARQCWW